jgi:hypothetical protein
MSQAENKQKLYEELIINLVNAPTAAVQLTLSSDGRVEDLHLQVSAPCRAHKKKKAGH